MPEGSAAKDCGPDPAATVAVDRGASEPSVRIAYCETSLSLSFATYTCSGTSRTGVLPLAIAIDWGTLWPGTEDGALAVSAPPALIVYCETVLLPRFAT